MSLRASEHSPEQDGGALVTGLDFTRPRFQSRPRMSTRVEKTPTACASDASMTPPAGMPVQDSTPRTRWVDEVRANVDLVLADFLESKHAIAQRIAGDSTKLVSAIADITLRGGKRLRPAVTHAAYVAVGGREEPKELAVLGRIGAALELLQTYLLIHDDWMDRDDQRRGGPSAHILLRDQVGGDAQLGDALAILAGDLASSYAWELFVAEAFALGASGPALVQAFLRLHQEVVLGQELDLIGSSDVPRMQRLKSGSYTVEGPLRIGAVLAGATEAQHAVLEAMGTPLGEAFQIRDDLLGAFGDPARTGKPSGSDIRAGKRTALVRECERAALPEERALLASVLGHSDASDAQVESVLAMFVRTGIKERVEQRLHALIETARRALETDLLTPRGIAMLSDLVAALAWRES